VRIGHDMLGECVLDLLPPATRRAVHAYIASHLERGFETSHDAALLWDCAEQWVMSGDTDKAVEFLRRCALHAADLGRAAQALRLLERVMELVTDPGEKAEVLRDMMISGKAAGHWSEVHRCSQQLAALSAESPTHSDIELLSVEACWMMSFQVGDATTRLLACASAVTADPNHRLDAAILLMRIAHERGDAALARSAYESAEKLLTNTGYSSRLLPLIYHTSFGDRDRALEAARALRHDLASFQPITLQFRAGFNVATAFAYLGEREALDLYRELYDLASQLGMKAWQWQFASSLCWWQLEHENVDAAEEWYERTEGSRPGDLMSTAERRKNVGCACEIALRRHDVPRAREMILRLRAVGAAESIRAAIYIDTFELRLLQLDQSTLSTDEEIDELMRVFSTGRSLIGVDFLVVALGEALRRRGRQREAQAILDAYAREYRRERSPLPQSFLALRDRICMEIRLLPEDASVMLSGCANALHVVTPPASRIEASS